MRLRFKIVLPTLIILGLIGFQGQITYSGLKIRYGKETEWVKAPNSVEKDSKSYFFSFYLNSNVEPTFVKPWSDDHISHFNEVVRVKLISQTKTYRKRDPMIIRINSLYTPRKSIDLPHLS